MKHTSPFADREKLANAIDGAQSKREVVERLGLRSAGGNYKQLKKYSELYGLELPLHKPKPPIFTKQIPDSDVFVKNSTFTNRASIKQRLYDMGVKQECVECGLGTIWNDKPITLQLDHINGVPNDNRIDNLAILCPNCHSQTATYAGGNFKIIDGKPVKPVKITKPIKKKMKICINCNSANITHSRTKMCDGCHTKYVRESRAKRYGVDYPDYDTLKNSIEKLGYVKAAAELGISDSALRKRMKRDLPSGESLPKYISKSRNNKNNK